MTPRPVPEWIGRRPDSMPGKLVRDRLSRAQNDCCACCGLPFNAKRKGQCDHKLALIDGGENRERNLQMICTECHKSKTAGEAAARRKSRDIRAGHLFVRPKSQWPSRGFPPANPKRNATSPIIRKSERTDA